MAINLRWVGEDEFDRVAEARMRCYAAADRELEKFQQSIRADGRAKSGDFLLAESDGEAVGTSTSYSMTMWVRGAPMSCQGVAYVGTIKTHRRSGRSGEKGIASQVMCETLRMARERGHVVSALMPFRGSYYEHFGYGFVERRNDWTVPLGILPSGDCRGMRYMREADLPQIKACHQKMVQKGQCDLERTDASWARLVPQWVNGFCVVDESDRGQIQSWMYIEDLRKNDKRLLCVWDSVHESHEAFMRQLYFLAGLRDQYSAVQLFLPGDLQFNRLLKESQLEHRPVEHFTAHVTSQTRLQVRILDHVRFLESLKVQSELSGRIMVGIRESEGTTSTINLELEAGRIRAKPSSGEADLECTDSVWASIACGDISASAAARIGLVRVTNPNALRFLDTLAIGSTPFCNEWF